MTLQAELSLSALPFTSTTTWVKSLYLWELTPSIASVPVQSLTVWARKWDLQMVSYTDDEVHTAAPAPN